KHDQLARVVAERFGLDFVDLSLFEVDMGAVGLLPPDACQRYRAVPIGFDEDNVVLLAMADPTNVLTLDDVAMMTGRRVKPVAASLEDLGQLLTRLAHMDSTIEDINDDAVEAEDEVSARAGVEENEGDAPIIKFVHSNV